MKAIVYHVLKNPSVKAKLIAELFTANLSFPAAYKSLDHLPYLHACISEGLRCHPVVGHIFERVVPAGGLKLPDGTLLPPGTIVGANPWIIHTNASIYGENADKFVPERWLRGPDENQLAFEARVRKMKDADLSFGGGNRICLGRPLAMVELFKVVATLFDRYHIELEDPGVEWELHKQWFVWPHKIRVKMSLREAS